MARPCARGYLPARRDRRGGHLKLILLDVDMTLLSTRGAGVASLEAAMQDVFGRSGAFSGVEFAGRTDRLICEDGLSRAGLDDGPANMARLRGAYVRRLAMVLSGGWPAMPLPGVRSLLDELSARSDALFGLLTGNWTEGAWLKLAACGLDGYFTFGAFAECGRTRTELVPEALRRAEALSGRRFHPGDTWVVGDTPHDISCALDWGLRSIAVATGPYDQPALSRSGAEAVLPTLEETSAIMGMIFGCPS